MVGKARKPPLVKTSAFTFTDVSITLPTLSNYTSFTSPPPFSSSPQLTLSFHLLLLLPLWTHPQALILMPSQTPCPCTQRYSYLPVLCTIILITHSHTLTLTHTHTHSHVHQGRITRQKQQRAAIPPSDSDTPSPPTKRVAASRTWADQGKPGGRQNSKQLSSRRVAPPRGTDSFSFDSDPESDISWEIKVCQ